MGTRVRTLLCKHTGYATNGGLVAALFMPSALCDLLERKNVLKVPLMLARRWREAVRVSYCERRGFLIDEVWQKPLPTIT
jgi:hypothetical protein